MRKGKVMILMASALVAGLVLGSVGLASAATSTTGATNGLGGIMRQAGGSIAVIVAKVTGQSTEDVYAARKDGKSFADIAKSEGVSSDKLVSDVLAARKAALDAAVKSGKITAEQAAFMYDRQSDRIADRITQPAPEGCDGTGSGAGGGGRGMGGGRGAGGGCGGACTTP